MGERAALLLAAILALLTPLAVYAQAPPAGESGAGHGQPPVYANTIRIPGGGFIVGVCYPWVVLSHGLLDLSTWTMKPGVGGDTVVSVDCGSDYFIVKGVSAVYVIDSRTGDIREVVALGKTLSYIGEAGGVLAFLDRADRLVLVHTPFTGDMHIRLPPANISDIRFAVYNGVPVIAYIAEVNSTRYLILANPTKTRIIAELPATSNTLYIYGDYVIVEHDGLRAYRVTNPDSLSVEEYAPYAMYLPFDLERIESGTPEDLLAVTAAGIVVRINLVEKTWKFLGEGVVTPAGVFVYNPASPGKSTTYVEVNGTWYPVPGYAVARIGYLALTNIIEPAGNGTRYTPLLWPIIRTNLVVKEPLDGLLQVPDEDGVKIVRLSLAPGVYALPRYSTLLTSRGAIPLDKDEVQYPPVFETPPEINSSLVEYTVASFPPSFSPVDTFTNVRFVSSGAGKLLIITDREAIVYSAYGVSAVIPGVWLWGGIGDRVVLYDGASFRVYDYAGNPVEAYQAYVAEKPVYVTYDEGKIHLYTEKHHIIITRSGVTRRDVTAPMKYDAVYGTVVRLTQRPVVLLGRFTYAIPRANTVTVNRYSVAWTYTRGNTTIWGVLDIPSHRVYILVDAPPGRIYPLGDYLAYYNGSAVMILPFTSWIISKCFVDIRAPPEARILINGRYVGVGSLRYYTRCYEEVNVTAVEPYHKPASVTVVVRPGGVSIAPRPEPLVSNVKLVVTKPEKLPIVSVTLNIDGRVVEWRVGDTIQLIATKPYNITVVSFHPFDVCEHESLTNVVFREGNDTLRLRCRIVNAVLGVTSNATALVEIKSDGNTIYVGSVGPNAPIFTIVDPGGYVVTAKPLTKGYVERTVNVTIPPGEIVVVDVTPYRYSRLVIGAVPPVADIRVVDPNGTVVGEGTGSLTVELPPGEYQVVAVAPGFQQHVESVVLNPGEDKIVNITLIPVPTHTRQAGKPFWSDARFQAVVVAAVAGAVAFTLWYRKRREETEMGEEVVEGGE